MEEGGAVSPGRSGSRAASTVRRSSSKNGGSFIAAGNWRAAGCRGASRFGLPLGIERLGGKLAIGFLQEDFHSPLRFFQLLLTLTGERNAFFEQLHRVVQSELTGRPAQCAGSALRSGGRVFPRGRRREEYFPTPGTTTPDRESRAPDAHSILRHARERTQLLCAGGALPAVSRCWRGGEGRGERATAIRTSRYCQYRRRAFDPARNPSRDALNQRAIG